ncbi:MAG TPA: T9SS type A sorting domain-containing protein [Bacteroidales bacterium]|nr:T9SS type A sorting domain-containing protein [Bacteroidales bacterium]
MKIKRLPLIIGIVFILVFSSFIAFYPTGAPAGYTGSPGDGKNCTDCHTGTASTVSGWITSNIPATGYEPGQTYQITATNNITGSGKYGFEVSPQNTSGTLLGTLAAGSNNQLVGNNKYVTHVSASETVKTWTFNWTAPAAGTGNVTFYGAFARNKPGPVRLSTLSVSEFILTPPGPAGPIAGSSQVCIPNSYNYSIPPISGATGYVWTAPAGATITSGQGTVAVAVTYGTSAVSGNLAVYGTNGAGNGTAANLFIDVNQIAELPATPTGPATVDLSLTTISDYSTTGSANADSYIWELSPSNAGTITGNGLSATVEWGSFLGLASIRVKAVNTCGESNWTSAVQTEVINTTGITIGEATGLSVYPNPGEGVFVITLPQLPESALASYNVYNRAGTLAASGWAEVGNDSKARINLSGKPSGMYFVTVMVNGKQFTGKIIVR